MYEEALKFLSAWPVVQGAVAVLLVLYGVRTMRREAAAAPPHHEPDVPSWVYRLGVDDCIAQFRQSQTNSEHAVVLMQDVVSLLIEIREELKKMKGPQNDAPHSARPHGGPRPRHPR